MFHVAILMLVKGCFLGCVRGDNLDVMNVWGEFVDDEERDEDSGDVALVSGVEAVLRTTGLFSKMTSNLLRRRVRKDLVRTMIMNLRWIGRKRMNMIKSTNMY